MATCFPADQVDQKKSEGWFVVGGPFNSQAECQANCGPPAPTGCTTCPDGAGPEYYDLTFDIDGTGDFAQLNGESIHVPRFSGILCNWVAVDANGWSIVVSYVSGFGLQVAATKSGSQVQWAFLSIGCCTAGIDNNPTTISGTGNGPSTVLIVPGPC